MQKLLQSSLVYPYRSRSVQIDVGRDGVEEAIAASVERVVVDARRFAAERAQLVRLDVDATVVPQISLRFGVGEPVQIGAQQAAAGRRRQRQHEALRPSAEQSSVVRLRLGVLIDWSKFSFRISISNIHCFFFLLPVK